MLTASRANEVSLESPRLGHGVFTQQFIQALLGMADANHDGITSLAEAVQFITQTVSSEAKTLGGAQHPVFKGEVTGDFPIAIGSVGGKAGK